MRDVFIKLFVLSINLYFTLAQSSIDYKVTSLPGIEIQDLKFEQYAGHIEISNKTNANIFFWMIENEIKTETEKLIIWLNGGPGCSSMDGLFLENGPYRVNKDLTLSINQGGWQKYATNVFVDQPVGTGFSFTEQDGYMHNMDQVTDGFITFIDKLFTIFPQLQRQDLYIAGESYAGTYIPYFTARILELNKQKEKKYNIKGIAIGNGWISPKHQYSAYYDFGVQMNLVDGDDLELMSEHFKVCQEAMEEKETVHVNHCERVMSDIMDSNTHSKKHGDKVCINMYDVRLKEEEFPECGLTWPYELKDITKYLRLPEVKMAIHADKQLLNWTECTSLVSRELKDKHIKPAYYLLPDILNEIQVLLYSGEFDLICNYLGTEYLVGNMTWNGYTGFNSIKEEWKVDGKLAGYITKDRNLSYFFIKDGSHMVPYDRPMECLDMMNRFMDVKETSQASFIEKRPESLDNNPQDLEKKVTNYYGFGMAGFILMALFGLFLGYHKKYLNTRLLNRFIKRKGSHHLDEESNELDELVVTGTPILFETEELSDSDTNSHHHFVIDNEEDEED